MPRWHSLDKEFLEENTDGSFWRSPLQILREKSAAWYPRGISRCHSKKNPQKKFLEESPDGISNGIPTRTGEHVRKKILGWNSSKNYSKYIQMTFPEEPADGVLGRIPRRVSWRDEVSDGVDKCNFWRNPLEELWWANSMVVDSALPRMNFKLTPSVGEFRPRTPTEIFSGF